MQAYVEVCMAALQADGFPTQPDNQPSHDAPSSELAGCPKESAAQAGYHHQQVFLKQLHKVPLLLLVIK